MLTFIPAVLILQVLPIGISGLGVREGSLVLFLSPLGVPDEQAVALGLLLYLTNLIASLAGAPKIYGSLPIVHDTGGLHDTVQHLEVAAERGNGFVFESWDAPGLSWAIDQAMQFHGLPEKIKNRQIQRIMTESLNTFNHENTARRYIEMYEKMLKRQLIVESMF